MNLRVDPFLATDLLQKKRPGEGFQESIDNLSYGSVNFVNGAFNTRIFSDINTKELYEAYFEGIIPEIRTLNGNVTVDYERGHGILDMNQCRGKISLNSFIPWELIFHGGVSGVTADLRELNLKSINIFGGVNNARILLPEPDGNIPVKVTGGVKSLEILRPKKSHARLHAIGGAARLSFDQNRKAFSGDETLFETPAYHDAGDRYAIIVGGGSINLTVRTY